MLTLLLRNLVRRPLRSILTLAGVAAAMAVLVCVGAFGEGYRTSLKRELEAAGLQMMMVPLGCPYDAAARVLKNQALEASLPEGALAAARNDPAVAVAAPLLMVAMPRPNEHRTDLWVGLDQTALPLKPWWHARQGAAWFLAEDEVILGADAAQIEMRAPGEKLFSPETGREFRVAGVLARSGTSDDSAFFVPLSTARKMFHQEGRLTAIAIRLKDPVLGGAVERRLRETPGAQVVTMTEMMGTFLNLIGAVRTLVLAVAFVAVAVGALMIFNTLLAAVIERTNELAVMRAVGASRTQVFGLVLGEALLLSVLGAVVGIILAFVLGADLERMAKGWISFAPAGSLLKLSGSSVLRCFVIALATGALAACYPAWRAARLAPASAVKNE